MQVFASHYIAICNAFFFGGILSKRNRKMEVKSFILHDETVNTYGFRMLTSGANLEEFRKNPVLFFAHREYELPIGRWENIRVEGTQILADPVFDMDDPEAAKIAGKVERGFIRAASIGTWAPEEVSKDPNLKLPGQTGPTVTKWTVREASIVAIGANHNALRMYDRTTGESLDLEDRSTVLRLMDSSIKNTDMKNLKSILKLQDGASDADVEAAVQKLQQDNEDLQQQNQTLEGEKATLEQENTTLRNEKAAAEQQRLSDQKAEAQRLVDAAVRDGRINASGKEAFIALFDADFEKAKATLNAIPRPKSVQQHHAESAAALSDKYSGKSWNELDREGLLVKLRDEAPEIYREKFREEFGHDPKN